MSKYLTKEQIEDLLHYIGVTEIRSWKGDKIQFCCPIHGESHPSCGINIDYAPDGTFGKHYQVYHCFSCGSGGSIPKFLYESLPDKFRSIKEAAAFLKARYNVEYSVKDLSDLDKYHHIPRYGEVVQTKYDDKRVVLPKTTLAIFKSGKETYQYFFERGFTKEDMKEYMIGRDLVSETVTIPIFWEDNTLAGVIGRYIDPNRPKNMRFRIYDFEKGSTLYLLNKLEVHNDTIIGVESMLDAIMLRKWGHFNVIATMGDGMSKKQANMIAKRCSKYICLADNDAGGEKATSIAYSRLKDKVTFLVPTYYPDFGKDPCEWGELETNKVIGSSKIFNSSKLPRL